MRRMRSVKAALKVKMSALLMVLLLGSLARMRYLPQEMECRMRIMSSSGRFTRSFISCSDSFSSAHKSQK